MPVPTDISGVLNTSPTESQRVCPHYVKRDLRAPSWESDSQATSSISSIHELLFKIKISAVYVKGKSDEF
jgi:hypothetical protein